ncbi:MAG: MBL fold metallo-hydrolase [Bacteroidota bacterium]
MSEDPRITVTLLGTGTSTGIPVIGCHCSVCRSLDPRDRRGRASCWVRADDLSIIIDTGPDFRRQALREGITRVDAVLYTHHHFDHIVGLDDLRPYLFQQSSPIPCFARKDTADVIRNMFGYIFSDGTYPGVPDLELHIVDRPFVVHGRYDPCTSVKVTPIDVRHGSMPLFGYRIGDFAYITDTNAIPDASLRALEGVEILVLDALRHEHHPTHFSISEAVDVARRIGARQTYFTHMTHSVLHAPESESLPPGIDLGYDGLTFDL